MRIFMIYGQGGLTFSAGFRLFGESLERKGYQVSYWMPRRPELVIHSILQCHEDEPIAILGYSLGANAATWITSSWEGYVSGLNKHHRKVELIVGFDPTVNSHVSSLTPNVKRAICFQQTSTYWVTSWAFGRAVYDGPQVEIHKVNADHLIVQSMPRLHEITIAALEKVKNGQETA